MLQRIDRVMRWAVGNNHRDERIDMDLVRDALPRQPKRRSTVRRMPSVPWREAPDFCGSIAYSPSAPEIRLALSLQILTASRPGNVRLAKRAQFDLKAGTVVQDGKAAEGYAAVRESLAHDIACRDRTSADGGRSLPAGAPTQYVREPREDV